MTIDPNVFENIQNLVGDSLTQENLAFVDCFVHDWLAIFMPVGGHCGYAITPSHTHPSYMFIIAYDNQSVVYVENEKFETYAESLFCLAPDVAHHEEQDYLPPKYCAVFIDKEQFEQNLRLYTKEIPKLYAHIADIENSKMDRLIKEFIFESQNIHRSKHVVLENLSTLLTHEIIRTILRCNRQNSAISENQKINASIKYIHAHYEKKIALEDLAQSVSLSKSHFIKLFTKTMQTTPMEYLKQIRVQNAKKMLLANKLTITAISQQCGFNSPSYFTKTFKAYYHETPKEFMQRSV